jgi:hypothetical protein
MKFVADTAQSVSFHLTLTLRSARHLSYSSQRRLTSLSRDDNGPVEKAYHILREMTARGKQVASSMVSELRQLEAILAQVPPLNDRRASRSTFCQSAEGRSGQHVPSVSSDSLAPPFVDCAIGDADWQYTMTMEQMIEDADFLNFESFDWGGL